MINDSHYVNKMPTVGPLDSTMATWTTWKSQANDCPPTAGVCLHILYLYPYVRYDTVRYAVIILRNCKTRKNRRTAYGVQRTAYGVRRAVYGVRRNRYALKRAMLPDSCQRVGSISVTNDVEEKE